MVGRDVIHISIALSSPFSFNQIKQGVLASTDYRIYLNYMHLFLLLGRARKCFVKYYGRKRQSFCLIYLCEQIIED